MVPNKICRSQNFGDANGLLEYHCEAVLHGMLREREPAGPARGPGALGPSPAPEPFGFGRLRRRPSPRVSASGDIGLQPLCNHGAITRPRIPQDRRTALKDTPHGISQATLLRLRVRRYNRRMFRYKNRAGIFWGLLSLCIALSVVLSQPTLLAQGLFIVVSDPTEVAKTNRSALSGSLIFVVEAGTTGPGKIVIDYGIPIEDPGTVPEDSGAAIEETELASGILTVEIPRGVSTREPITLSGVRFDMAATDVERVVANLRVAPGSGFVIRKNHLSVEVISRVLPGLEVDLESDLVFILPANFFRPASLTLALKEGFPAAFSGNTGQSNQNVPTRVQIQIEGLPEGVSVTFPDSVSTSASDATFTVLGGSETTLPTEDGDRSITYAFQKGRTSDTRVETFKFDYTVEMVTPDVESTDDSPPPEKGPVVAEPTAVFLQATLAPGESEECQGGPVCSAVPDGVPSLLRMNSPCRNLRPISRSAPVSGRFGFGSRIGEIWT